MGKEREEFLYREKGIDTKREDDNKKAKETETETERRRER